MHKLEQVEPPIEAGDNIARPNTVVPASVSLRMAALLRISRLRQIPDLAIVGIIGLLSLLLSGAVVLTKRPWCDEAWFASPAYNLSQHGFMGLTILDPHGFAFAAFAKGINQLTYLIMPGYLLAQAGWYKIFGFGLTSMRSMSMVWSMIALGATFVI